jgi:hypothetical protein
MIDIDTHPELYSYACLDHVKNSLNFAKHLPNQNDITNNTIHFYWRVPREFGRKQLLPLKSAIATQNLQNTKIILWSNVSLVENPYFKEISKFVENRIWDLHQECKNTIIENSHVLSNATDDALCWLGGDIFRLLCLYKYGGTYVDMDMVLLRDLNPLLPYEFMYQWGSSGLGHPQEPVIKQNGAIMKIDKNSKLGHDLVSEILRIPAQPNSTCWGTQLYHKVWLRNKNWKTFPCAWFNTEWGFAEPWEPFKSNINKPVDLYDGAFSWHWHNRWDEEIQPGSKFDIVEKYINTLIGKII